MSREPPPPGTSTLRRPSEHSPRKILCPVPRGVIAGLAPNLGTESGSTDRLYDTCWHMKRRGTPSSTCWARAPIATPSELSARNGAEERQIRRRAATARRPEPSGRVHPPAACTRAPRVSAPCCASRPWRWKQSTRKSRARSGRRVAGLLRAPDAGAQAQDAGARFVSRRAGCTARYGHPRKNNPWARPQKPGVGSTTGSP